MLSWFEDPFNTCLPSPMNKSYQFTIDSPYGLLSPGAMTSPDPSVLDWDAPEVSLRLHDDNRTSDLDDWPLDINAGFIDFKPKVIQKPKKVTKPMVMKPFESLQSVEMTVAALKAAPKSIVSFAII